MTMYWGDWTSGYSNNFRVGLDLWVSGTTVYVGRYVESQYEVHDSQTCVVSGSISNSQNFSMDMGSSGGSMKIGSTLTRSGSRGSTYTFTIKVTGIYNGASPTFTKSITVPALVPGKPSIPTISSLTDSSWTAKTTAPASNGDSIDGYQWQWATNSGFTTGTGYTTSSGTSRGFSGFDSNETYWLRVRAENGVGYGGWSSARSFTTKADAPAAPSSVSASRNSDTSHTVSWTRNATSEAPYTSQRVQRWDASTNAWTTVYTLGTDYTNSGTNTWTDTGTKANRRYRYRVYGSNGSGNSGYGYSAYFYTTPATATAITATKNAAGNIIVSWTSGAAFDTRWEVWHAADGSWDGARLTLTTEGTTTYTHTSPNASVTHTYRVRPVQGSLTGSYSANSNVVQLQAAPLAPTLTAPANGAVLPDDEDVVFTWTHNPVDTTPQTAAEIEIEDTTYVLTDEQTYTLPLASLDHYGFYYWRVRTKGAHASYGPWSPLQSFESYARPVASLDDPDTNVSRLEAEWSVDIPFSFWEAELLSGGELLEAASGETETSHEFSTALLDATTYTLRVRVQAPNGLWSDWAETTWTTDFPLPEAPEVQLAYDPASGGVNVAIQNIESGENIIYDWEGTPGESRSTRTTSEGVVTNYAVSPRTLSDAWSSTPASVEQVTGTFPGGTTTAVRYTLTRTYLYGYLFDPIEDSALAGKQFSASADIVCNFTGTITFYAGGREPGDTDGATGASSTTVNVTAGVPVHAESSYLPTSSNFATWGIFIGATGRSVGDTITITNVMINEGTEPVDFFDGDSQDFVIPETTSNQVDRRLPDGDWETLITGLPANATWTDNTALIGGVTEYRVLAWSDLPTNTATEVSIETPVEHRSCWTFLSGGEDYSIVVRIRGHVLNRVPAVETAQHNFAGRTKPFTVWGATETLDATFTGALQEDSSTAEDFINLQRLRGPVLYRDCQGRRIFGTLTALNLGHDLEDKKVSFTVSESEQ